MATAEEKKRVGGIKVSAIANIFQSKPDSDNLSYKSSTIFKGDFKESSELLKESPNQISVVRTESHVARFNNARALFEKLGEENKISRQVDLDIKSGDVHDVNLKLNFKTSSIKYAMSTSLSKPQSLLSKSEDDSQNSNNGSVSSNNENLENIHLPHLCEFNKLKDDENLISCEENSTKNNYLDTKDKFDNITRKLNSKELIKKQKNWTSHFSRLKCSKYNSDLNKPIETSLNEGILKINIIEKPNYSSQSKTSIKDTFTKTTNIIDTSLNKFSSFYSTESPTISKIQSVSTKNPSINEKREDQFEIIDNVSMVPEIQEYDLNDELHDKHNSQLNDRQILKNTTLSHNKIEPEYAVIQKKKLQHEADSLINPSKIKISSKPYEILDYDNIVSQQLLSENSLKHAADKCIISNETKFITNTLKSVFEPTTSANKQYLINKHEKNSPDMNSFYELCDNKLNDNKNNMTSISDEMHSDNIEVSCKDSLLSNGKKEKFDIGLPENIVHENVSDHLIVLQLEESENFDYKNQFNNTKEKYNYFENTAIIPLTNVGVTSPLHTTKSNLLLDKKCEEKSTLPHHPCASAFSKLIETETKCTNIITSLESNLSNISSFEYDSFDFNALHSGTLTNDKNYEKITSIQCTVGNKHLPNRNSSSIKKDEVVCSFVGQTESQNFNDFAKCDASFANLFSNIVKDKRDSKLLKTSHEENIEQLQKQIEKSTCIIDHNQLTRKNCEYTDNVIQDTDFISSSENTSAMNVFNSLQESLTKNTEENNLGEMSLDTQSSGIKFDSNKIPFDIMNDRNSFFHETFVKKFDFSKTCTKEDFSEFRGKTNVSEVLEHNNTNISILDSTLEASCKQQPYEENQDIGDIHSQDVFSISDFSIINSNNQDNSLSYRSRSDLTLDSLSESRIGNGNGSELLRSVSSLNGSNDCTEIESQEDYIPKSAKIVLVENGVHYFEDGHFWMEVTGIPKVEGDNQSEAFSESLLTKKICKVSFDTGPIKVYSTHSINEYDRRNEDVDPVAASAEYELEKRVEKMEIFPVELIKGPDGLGLSIIGMGVGADAGLEKLGIFVKTITEKGAAAREGRIQVNDQIVEVDGKSLVGVTQAYAASVLRNTSGLVRFIIGRDRDPHNSEVAMLIKQSLQADKEREEIQENEDKKRKLLIANALSKETCKSVEKKEINSINALIEPVPESITTSSILEDNLTHKLSETFFSTSINNSSITSTSTNLNDTNNLKIFLQELLNFENKGVSREQYADKLREIGFKLYESDQALHSMQQNLNNIREMFSQATNQCTNFQQKYVQAKRTVRELRADIITRDEFYQQLLQEKDVEYNSLVKNLKDKVIALEKELSETQKCFGLPIRLPYDGATTKSEMPQLVYRKFLPLSSLISNQLSDNEISDLSSPDEEDKMATVERKLPLPIPIKEELDKVIPAHCLLDNSASKNKAELASRGGLANRQLPKRSGGLYHSSSDTGIDKSDENVELKPSLKNKISFSYNNGFLKNLDFKESDFKLCSDTSNSYFRNRKYINKAQSAITKKHSTISSTFRTLTQKDIEFSEQDIIDFYPKTEQLKQILYIDDQESNHHMPFIIQNVDNVCNKSSSQSNNSKLITHNLVEEIEQAVTKVNKCVIKTDTIHFHNSENIDGSYSSLSSSNSISPPVVDLSKSTNIKENASIDYSDVWLPSDSENLTLDDKKNDSWNKVPISEWSKEHVYQWLISLGLNVQALQFIKAGINGINLVRLETRDLKAFGVSGEEKNHLKQKLKELKTKLERERKERKQIEKIQKKMSKFQKKNN